MVKGEHQELSFQSIPGNYSWLISSPPRVRRAFGMAVETGTGQHADSGNGLPRKEVFY